MTRIFIDSSVFFSAAYSDSGHSRNLLLMAANEEITIVVSDLVIEETRRNLSDFSPGKLPFFEQILDAIPFEYVRPTKREVVAATKFVVLKDAPIVAAAKKANVDLLVTLDKKHLLGKTDISEYARVPIFTPKEAFEIKYRYTSIFGNIRFA